MTAKNKKSSSYRANKALQGDAQTKDTMEDAIPKPKGFQGFTNAQLVAVVFFCIGCSKLVEYNTALKQGHENPESCLSYLGQENADVCSNPSFSSLIQAKYYSGLSLTGYLLIGMILLWKYEGVFMRYMMTFTLSPLVTTVFATIFNFDVLQRNSVWSLLILCTVLYGIIAPTSIYQLPFIVDTSFKPKSLQAMTLLGLCAFSLYDVLAVVGGPKDLANSLLTTEHVLPSPAKALVSFWLVDKFSICLVYSFALLHFQPHHQRSFLFHVAVIKSLEYYLQMTKMQEPYQNEFAEEATIAAALAAFIAWFV